ncbi:class I SAM-dependent methyltransferase [Streptomyces sp. NBC_01260]|uniref:class I SAM-dependent methyltransferase n=1 Tax=unclassified Streptomyces TaxID=2593676 RepID=UPI002251FE9A|nr:MULTISPECIES: class I SAM-dependent methyltransferase [unclassified Streptomyces]MCX4771934.1 class I SAM-dependent methyltransferase [Streptomyces sp. NBC_01285]
MNQPDVTAVMEDRYRPVLANQAHSETLRDIYRGVYGAEYPEEVEPFGFVTMSDLRFLADALGEHNVQRLVDIGCGRGGPGLWVAREADATLHGVDIVAEAVSQAEKLAARMEKSPEATFHTASAIDTGLPDAAFDGAMSVDALWMVMNKMAAFEELARILQPGSPLVFTTWAPSHFDYTWFLEPAGFSGIETHEIAGSADRQVAVYERILQERAALTREMGAAAADVLLHEATEASNLLSSVPRVMVQAVRI